MDFQPISRDDGLERLSQKTERIASGVISLNAMLEQLKAEQQTTDERVDRLYDLLMQRWRREHSDSDPGADAPRPL